MTVDESAFVEGAVIPFLREHYRRAAITQEKWLGETGGFCDVWVESPPVILAVEVGTQAVRDECAQAVEYSTNHPAAAPVVILPEGHGDPATVRNWQRRGVVIETLAW